MLLWTLGCVYLFKLVFLFFFGYIPRSGIAESYGSSIFSFFEKPPYCFPQWLHEFTFLPTVYEGSLFSTSLPTFVICVLFDDCHSDRCEVILWFWPAFPWWSVMLSIFSCACWPAAFPLWKKMSIQFFCPFLIRFFFLCWVIWAVYIRCILIPYWSHHFLPFSRLSFHFVNDFLYCAKAFMFN